MPPSPVNLFNLSTPPSEMYLPFLKAPLIAYQESETTEQRIAWLFRAIHDINSILACHEEACKEIKERLDTVEAELVKLDEDLKIERAERIQADQDLSDRIDAEEAARIAADQQLQANIDSETAARQAADQQLQSNIDSETAARQAADQQLQSNIDSEIANRKAADTTLRNRIAAEEQARAEADQATAARLDTLEACCEDAATKSELATERNARANADTALDQRVSTLETKCANGECGGGTPPAQKTIEEYMSEVLNNPLFRDYNAGSSVIDGVYELATYHLEYDFTDAPYTDEEIAGYFSDKKILVNVKFNCSFQNITANNKAYELSMSIYTDEVAEKKKVYAISPYIEAGMISRTFFDGSTLYTPSINGRRIGINQLYVDVKCTVFSSEFVPLYDATNHLFCTVQVVEEPTFV